MFRFCGKSSWVSDCLRDNFLFFRILRKAQIRVSVVAKDCLINNSFFVCLLFFVVVFSSWRRNEYDKKFTQNSQTYVATCRLCSVNFNFPFMRAGLPSSPAPKQFFFSELTPLTIIRLARPLSFEYFHCS